MPLTDALRRTTQPALGRLKLKIESLQSTLAHMEATAIGHRAERREKKRTEQLMTELLQATSELMAARETTARSKDELEEIQTKLTSLKVRPWWRRLASALG